MRKPIIAGNWKMNKNYDEALEFIKAVADKVPSSEKVETAICAPALYLRSLVEHQGENLRIGAQNMHFEANGAFTGEIAPGMLKDLGVTYVILGHSERREYFGETNKTVNQRLLTALNDGFTPIVCIGESLEQRKNGQTEDFLATQIEEGLAGLSLDQASKVVIAYEPIWAIGTGVTATAQQAQETICFARKKVEQLFGKKIAQEMYFLYGGSMNENNARDLLSMPDIDGGLIGGASLVAEKFAKIVNAIN